MTSEGRKTLRPIFFVVCYSIVQIIRIFFRMLFVPSSCQSAAARLYLTWVICGKEGGRGLMTSLINEPRMTSSLPSSRGIVGGVR